LANIFFSSGSQKVTQIVVLLAALFLIVLLVLAPRIPKEAREVAKAESEKVVDPVDQRINQAVALVQSGDNPMQGIMKLREILEENPDRVDIHWHLAHFSVQSGQYDKAAERFEKVIEMDSENRFPDAAFYLGKTYATLDRSEEAVQVFESYLENVQDSTVRKRVEEFIEELKH
jgi:thioredoxin-like negative regulator of GroEL